MCGSSQEERGSGTKKEQTVHTWKERLQRKRYKMGKAVTKISYFGMMTTKWRHSKTINNWRDTIIERKIGWRGKKKNKRWDYPRSAVTSTILTAGTISIAEFLLRPGTQLFCHQNCGSIEGIWVACTVVLRKHARYTLIRLYIYCISRKHCRPRLAPSLSALRVQHILWRDTRVGLADYNKGFM